MYEDMLSLAIEVGGVPQPQGSKTRGRFGNIREDNDKLAPWRFAVVDAIRDVIADQPGWPITEPVALRVTFYFPRPRSHYGTGRNAGTLKPSAPGRYHGQKPDADKLLRAICDSVKAAGAVRDDSQIAYTTAAKMWDTHAFAAIELERLPEWHTSD